MLGEFLFWEEGNKEESGDLLHADGMKLREWLCPC